MVNVYLIGLPIFAVILFLLSYESERSFRSNLRNTDWRNFVLLSLVWPLVVVNTVAHYTNEGTEIVLRHLVRR